MSNPVLDQDHFRPLREYTNPIVDEIHQRISRPTIQANNFELKSFIIQIVQISQFGETPIEDHNLHLVSFLEICTTFKYNDISDDVIRLKLFSFSLKGGTRLRYSSDALWETLKEKTVGGRHVDKFKKLT
ncbi:hypothetical protein KFK09_013129 [Dendrobium nobile]|uniref:Uncharacterized protein n=1 Tax=Dendrobium nobile TaxID=94219 RepID=A0A8T3B7X3_DENNO|nr:hypothetical protein KFK09_013129 [Dendrobium nobile]